MKLAKLTTAIVASTTALLGSVSAQAQTEPEPALVLEEVFVTGSAVARSSFDTPAQTSSFNEDEFLRLSASSNADLLRQVPGISAEGGGGEVAVNVFIPGLVAAGQYSFTPLNFDGFTVFSYFGLNSSSFDVFVRPDVGVERMEFIRGGASNLFGPGSTAGIINYISKTGSDEPESVIQLELAEENRIGTSFATSGPMGEGNYYALSGFYRYDEGPISTGLDTEGYQLKGNFRHEFSDGSGSFSIYAQTIDDRVQFYLPLPMDADSQDFTRGNGGSEVNTIQTGEIDNLVYPTANGNRELQMGDGVTSEGETYGLVFEKEYGSGWTTNIKAKYSSYDHNFAIFIPAGGDNVLTTDEFLVQQELDGFDDATFTVLSTGEQLPDGDRVYRTQAWERQRPMTDYTLQFDLSKAFESGTLTHYFTGGLWFSRAEADDFNARIFYLGDFSDEPRLLGLTLEGDDANTPAVETGTTYYSINGFAGSGGHVNAGGTGNRFALYIADQIEADRWSLDVGVRFEKFEGDFFNEGSASVAIDPSLYGLGPDVQLASVLQNDTTGNSQFDRLDVEDDAIAFALAGTFMISENINLYGNISSGFFWPQLRGFPGQVNDTAESLGSRGAAIAFIEDSFEAETVNRIEAGVKFDSDLFSGSIGAYYMEQSDNIQFSQIEQADGTFLPVTIAQDTEATGIDASGRFYFTDFLSLAFNASFSDQEVTAGPNEGFELVRQPDIIATTDFVFSNDIFDASLSYNYRGDSFGDSSNDSTLDAFGFWRASVGYTLSLDDDSSLHLSLSAFNLTDEVGLTEGNPRAGGAATGGLAVARPILPRRISFKATYRF